MGLDTFELVIAVEERFDVTIPDSIAGMLATVGALHGFVVAELARLGREGAADVVFAELRDLIVRHLGVAPDEVVMDARFVQDLRAD